MTDSQKRLLELLPKMAKDNWVKTFQQNSFGSIEVVLDEEVFYILSGLEAFSFPPGYHALIYEGVRQELKWMWYKGEEHPGMGECFVLCDTGDALYIAARDAEGAKAILTDAHEYDPWDDFDRARAACEALLEVAA